MMKYKDIAKIKVGSSMIYTTNKGLFIAKKANEKREIVHYNITNNEWDKFYSIDQDKVCDWILTKDFFIVSHENSTIFYTLNKEEVFKVNIKLSLSFVLEDDSYIYIEAKEAFYRFNKCQYIIDFFSISGRYLLLSCIFAGNLIFKQKGGVISLYKNILLDVKLFWQINIKYLFPNEEISISEVKEYNGSIIVVTTAGVLRLSAEDGSVIWKADGYARTMEIVDNIGYVCTGLSLLRINLDTGEESGYGWENHRLPDFTYKGKNYWPIGHKVVFHDGLLWYSVYSSGDSFLIAINPQNGNYEWIHYVDTNEKTDAPQFDEDKMFLWDTGNILHVYEKE